MRKSIITIGLLVLLVGCESEQEKAAKWQVFCTSHEFTAKQCEVLYVLKGENEDAANSANLAAGMVGMAVGMSAANGGRR